MLRIAPEAIASHSFDNAPEVDVLVVPGGMGTRWIEDPTNPVQNVLETFLAERAKTTKYMLSVCTGAVLLARSGVLDGKRATTNKSAWKYVTDPKHGKDVTWVPTARWVQDGNTWTSSGVAAGMDMMYAFLSYLYGGTSEGKKTVDQVMNIIEYAPHTDPHWDPFSVVYNVSIARVKLKIERSD
jgi:transcriptional regulator GlxA family with amidase domain